MNLKSRISEDFTINTQGKEIIDFCNETQLRIMNGRMENGKCTYHALQNNKVKKSVIDYLIVSESVLNSDILDAFEVNAPTLYTDHSPMILELKIQLKETQKIPRQQYVEQKSKKIKDFPYKWTKPNKNKFNNEEFKLRCNKLNRKLNDQEITNEDIFQEFIKIKDLAISSSKEERYKYTGNTTNIYSEDTRRSREIYKSLVDSWKKTKSQQRDSRESERDSRETQ